MLSLAWQLFLVVMVALVVYFGTQAWLVITLFRWIA